MQNKYKSPGARVLLATCIVLGLAVGLVGEGVLRLAALLAVVLLCLLWRYPRPRCGLGYGLIAAVSVVMLATGEPIALLWIWVLPLALQGFTGFAGLTFNIAGFVAVAAYLCWQLPLPSASMATLALAIVWLLCGERQRSRAFKPLSSEASWLLPPATLQNDIQHELRRGERESLAAEVVIFGCARSTSDDMTQLCTRLHDHLALFERAYRLNDYGVAVILIAIERDALAERRQQLEHAIVPHRLISTTPLVEAESRFGHRVVAKAPPAEAPLWQ